MSYSVTSLKILNDCFQKQEQLKLSNESLAELLDVSTTTIVNWRSWWRSKTQNTKTNYKSNPKINILLDAQEILDRMCDAHG
jgi:DNA-binding XRE family transcriptional regulator